MVYGVYSPFADYWSSEKNEMKISESYCQEIRPEFSEISDVICAKSRPHTSHNQVEAFSWR